MAILATDDFNGANGTSLTTHNSDWVFTNSTIDLQNNQANGLTVVYSSAEYQAVAWPNDQFSEAVFKSNFSSGSQSAGIMVRASATTGYQFRSDGNTYFLFRFDSPNFILLSAGSVAPNDGDIIRIEAVGTTITCFLNGSTTGAPPAAVDATYSSGNAGINFENGGPNARFDSFNAGDFVIPGGIDAESINSETTDSATIDAESI